MNHSPDPESAKSSKSPRGCSKWWIYQKERFPVFAHGLLVLAFSSSAVCFSHMLRGEFSWPRSASFAVAFVTCFLFFLGLRIADEFKDFEEDSQFRPYRPVPRGLISLRELGWLGGIAALLQLIVALWLAPVLVFVLFAGWIYLSLMSVDFFARAWLKARPITYLWTHMFIMPIVDFFATACDWIPAGFTAPPNGLFWFLSASFFNGIVIEFGRKIRAPVDEETGVQTYSVLWGRQRAVIAWVTVMAVCAVCAVFAAGRIQFEFPVALGTGLLVGISILAGRDFLKNPGAGSGKRFELISAAWTLTLYFGLGLIPMGFKIFQG